MERLMLALDALGFVLFAASLAPALWRQLRAEAKAFSPAAKQNMLALLQSALLALVHQAETRFGPRTGALKKASVMQELLQLLPPNARALFDANTLGAMIDDEVTRLPS